MKRQLDWKSVRWIADWKENLCCRKSFENLLQLFSRRPTMLGVASVHVA